MKSKPLTYLLIVSVAAVWGIIFYRIFSASGEEGLPFKPLVQSRLTDESLEDYTLKDTFTLLLNYRDPFLSKSSEPAAPALSSNTPAVVNSTFAELKPQKPPVNWEGVKYTGFISNAAGKRLVALMTIQGKEYMLAEGQSASGVKLLKNMKDSVKVSYQDKIKNIRIQ
jgi:hypothetical protein